jgi:uncharacterized protein YecT (DUF1311 family)
MIAFCVKKKAAYLAVPLTLWSLGAIAVLTPAHSQDRLYDWSNDVVAVESATSIAQECLDEYKISGDYLQRYACILKPAGVCRSQYDGGKQNQRDINRCAGFAADAWQRILDTVYNRLMESGSAPKQMEESQSRWKAWSDFDCHAISDYVGTRAELDFSSCRGKHAAERIFDLFQLIPQ